MPFTTLRTLSLKIVGSGSKTETATDPPDLSNVTATAQLIEAESGVAKAIWFQGALVLPEPLTFVTRDPDPAAAGSVVGKFRLIPNDFITPQTFWRIKVETASNVSESVDILMPDSDVVLGATLVLGPDPAVTISTLTLRWTSLADTPGMIARGFVKGNPDSGVLEFVDSVVPSQQIADAVAAYLMDNPPPAGQDSVARNLATTNEGAIIAIVEGNDERDVKIAENREKLRDARFHEHSSWTAGSDVATAAFSVTQSSLGSVNAIVALPYTTHQVLSSDGVYQVLVRVPTATESNRVRIRRRPAGGDGSTDTVYHGGMVPQAAFGSNTYYLVTVGRESGLTFGSGDVFTVETTTVTRTVEWDGEIGLQPLINRIKDASAGIGPDAGKVVIAGAGGGLGSPTLVQEKTLTVNDLIADRFNNGVNLDPWVVPELGKFLFELIEDDGHTYFKEIYASIWRQKGPLSAFQLVKNSGGEPIIVDGGSLSSTKPEIYALHRGGSNRVFIAAGASNQASTVKVKIWRL